MKCCIVLQCFKSQLDWVCSHCGLHLLLNRVIGRSSMPQRGSSATGGSMTTSHRSCAMFSTGCQSHSASSTSSVYSSSYHFTELLQSTCAIAASGLIPPCLGYVYDHLRRPIFGCGG